MAPTPTITNAQDHFDRTMGMLGDQLEAMRGDLHEQQAALQALRQNIRSDISAGMVDGIKTMMADKDSLKAFWRHGYDELIEHSSNGASQWVGKRILTMAAAAIATALVIWLVKSGAIK